MVEEIYKLILGLFNWGSSSELYLEAEYILDLINNELVDNIGEFSGLVDNLILRVLEMELKEVSNGLG